LIGRLGKEAEEGIDTLLTQAMDYEISEIPSLTGFLSWISDENIQIKRQFDSSANQIRVMTVHGAKGLEAPIVILPETNDFKNELSDEILFTENYAFKKFASTERSNKTATIYDDQKCQNSAERDRLLYVALTRAEVWLIVAAAGDVSDFGESWYKKIERGLVDLAAKTTPFSNGNGLCYQHGEWLSSQSSGKLAKKEKTVKLPPIFTEKVNTPLKCEKFINPSGLTGAKGIQSFDVDTFGDAKIFGTIVHLFLEKLPKTNPDNWQKILPNLLKWAEITVSEETQIKAYKQAEKILKKQSFEFIFAVDTLAEVQFSTIVKSIGVLPIVGVIDRLVISEDLALIIDFKTNKEVPTSVDEIPLGILKQMGAYAVSMQKVFPKKIIELGIIWTHSAELMKIDVNKALSSIDAI
jgi:ATP-dependent helicase/nuclease subunit A